jgi:hypothetical protein
LMVGLILLCIAEVPEDVCPLDHLRNS